MCYHSGAPEIISSYSGVRVAQSLVSYVVFCVSFVCRCQFIFDCQEFECPLVYFVSPFEHKYSSYRITVEKCL